MIDFQYVGRGKWSNIIGMKGVFGALFLFISGINSLVWAQQSELIRTSSYDIKGTPRIIHYSRKDFNGDPQIWDMTQGPDGIMYFGNNDGTLIFDGARWQILQIPNNSSIRSLKTTKDGKIYIGGFNDFGTIEKDEYGNYSYQSLFGMLRPEDRNLENIWDIHEVQGHMIFRSFTQLVGISGNKAFTVPVQNFYYSADVNDQLYLADPEGIKQLDLKTKGLKTLILGSQLANEQIAEIVSGDNTNELLIFVQNGAAYKYLIDSNTLEFLRNYLEPGSNNQVISGLKSSSGNIFLGTLSNQIIVLDQSGEIIPIENDFMALQDNTVLNLYESNEGNIWALLNNGIDCINITSPVSSLFQNASVFDVLIRGGRIYASTNQGVYVSDHIVQSANFSSLKFKKVPGTEGQSWSLQFYEGEILACHDRGVFKISDGISERIEGSTGAWKVIPIRGKENHYFMCTYTGIYLMTYLPDYGFKILYRYEGFNESSRDIMQGDEPGVFWVCHGYKGIFKVQFDNNYERVISVSSFQKESLPSPYNINVFRWNGEIIFTTNTGIYQYDPSTDKFKLHPELNEHFGTTENVRKLLQFEDKTWFVQNDEAGYFTEKDQTLQKGLFLELKGTFNRGMECIHPINSTNVLIGTTTGLYAYDLTFHTSQKPTSALISRIAYHLNDSLQLASLSQMLYLPTEANSIRFDFSAPQLKDQTNIQYSYKLEGIDENWSGWTESATREYTTLFPGKYTFLVRARSLIGEYANPVGYTFTVLPVWYLNKWALTSYVFISIGLILISRKLLKRKIEKERQKTRKEEKKKQDVLEIEIQKIKLEREKERIEKDKQVLEEDVIFKSKELANYTMLLVKKRELLTELRDDLNEMKEFAKNEKSKLLVRNLMRKIGIHLNSEEHIHVFEANFERVHHAFFQELKTHFPDLTSKELRLCALVKMNLTNKEIAPILNISLRGVETARYRLRKRLSLDQDENMVEFLEKLAPN